MIRLGQLPVTLKVGKKEWKIRTDYRDILVIMQAFNDPELTVEEAHVVMCKILYEGWTDMPKELYEEAAKKALWFLDCGQEDEWTGSRMSRSCFRLSTRWPDAK